MNKITRGIIQALKSRTKTADAIHKAKLIMSERSIVLAVNDGLGIRGDRDETDYPLQFVMMRAVQEVGGQFLDGDFAGENGCDSRARLRRQHYFRSATRDIVTALPIVKSARRYRQC